MRVRARDKKLVKRNIKALVDTGAEVNLMKKGLFPDELFRPAD